MATRQTQLEHVVLHHVPDGARLVVVGPAPADADLLGHRDLDVIDMGAVPQRLEQPIGEAQHHQVLHRLLAEIMIDPIDLLLGERPADGGIDLMGRGQVVPDGLFQDQPRDRRDQPGRRRDWSATGTKRSGAVAR